MYYLFVNFTCGFYDTYTMSAAHKTSFDALLYYPNN